jgi:hypothetical protein
MKTLSIVVLAAVFGFFGYEVAYPKIFDPTFFIPRDAEPSATTPSTPVEIPEVAALKPPPTKTPQPAPAPAMVPAAPVANDAPKKMEDPNEFHAPVFPALEDVVKHWTAIPKKAFPCTVKLRKKVEFVMTIGRSEVGAGGNVTALAQLGEKLIVAPDENSPARGQVAINDTDLRESLNRAYEAWKVQVVAFKRKQWEERQNAPQHKDAIVTPALASNDKPQRNVDGTYPLLLTSMKTGQVTDITPTNIKKWGEAKARKIDGKDYWVVEVEATIVTPFGSFDTPAEARIRNGRVEKWIYTGSGEVVP